jgi:hypothetical protein
MAQELARVPEGAGEALAWAEAEGVTALLASLWQVEVGKVAPAAASAPAWPDADA